MNALNNKDVLILHTASYLFAMRRIEANKDKTPQGYMDYFVILYLENQEHSPGCRGTCWPCYTQKYLDAAKSMLDLNKFIEYKEK